ncbi:hypothetical protein DNTS_031933 [Danionella cerebrum]|uniref:Complexin-1 n=1 Tax=Danionella cerebrum TaxID=2873325 RepID=A0A553Q751_9TELE|nr:hypothetical protein DNTS_031933 [Danionella translucida]
MSKATLVGVWRLGNRTGHCRYSCWEDSDCTICPSSSPTGDFHRNPPTAPSWVEASKQLTAVEDTHLPFPSRGPPDVGKMMGGEEEKDPEAEREKEEQRQEALRQEEEERKAKHAKMEAEREVIRQGIRDKYGIKKREEAEAEAQAAMEQASEGSLTRPKKAVPSGCGDEEEEEENIMDTVMKYLPGPLQDMLKK